MIADGQGGRPVSGHGEGEGDPMNEPNTTQQPDEGRLLTATELARLMNCPVSWLWAHGRELVFAIIPEERKRVWRYSYAGFRRWQEQGR
jgi:hypothetical protein